MNETQLHDVAKGCNRYPCISMTYKVSNEDQLTAGGSARVAVKLERDVVNLLALKLLLQLIGVDVQRHAVPRCTTHTAAHTHIYYL